MCNVYGYVIQFVYQIFLFNEWYVIQFFYVICLWLYVFVVQCFVSFLFIMLSGFGLFIMYCKLVEFWLFGYCFFIQYDWVDKW